MPIFASNYSDPRFLIYFADRKNARIARKKYEFHPLHAILACAILAEPSCRPVI